MTEITNWSQLNELVAKEIGWHFDRKAPPFSTSYAYIETIIDYLLSEEIGIDIWKTNQVSYCGLATKTYPNKSNHYGMPKWFARVGQPNTFWEGKELDSLVNSLPLAVCLAFLKYKNVEIELKIGVN